MDNKKIRFSTDVYWSVGVLVAMSLFMLADRWFAFLPAEADWVYVSCMSLSLLTAFDVYRCYKAAQKGGCLIATAVDLPWALVLLAGVLWLSVSAQISALRQIEVAGLLDMVCLVLNLWFILGLMGKRRYATGDADAATVDAFEYTLPAGRSSALSAVRKALSYIEYFSLVVFLAVLGYVLMEKGNIVVASVVFVLALVVLVASDSNLKSASDLAAALHQRLPYVKSVSIIVNREKTSMVIPEGAEEKVIYGKGYIMDRLSGLDFRISSKSFFQVNPHQAERLYTIAMNMADLREDDTVIDAYCGTGTIALIAAHVSGCRVIGVESNPEAVRDAEANARLNGLDNVSFITADASKYMKEMAKKGEHCSVLFLDPPRSGASEEFLAAAGRMAPERIVYISCNPETLGRDLRYIHRFMPYKTRGIQPVDLFPASAHIETAVFLDRY